jgi:phosphatidylethanolamine-binding protein (PEBP) family uncharacterized protein
LVAKGRRKHLELTAQVETTGSPSALRLEADRTMLAADGTAVAAWAWHDRAGWRVQAAIRRPGQPRFERPQNVSPPLAWSNVPDKTRSFAIIWDDQAGRAGLGVSHAVIYGIPANVTSFAEGELGGAPTAGRFVPGKNVLGMHWLGPCSPKGNAPQHYVMTIIATTVEPGELPAGLTKPELLKALEGGKALRAASMVLRFAQQ